jgi:hypothetical protein
MDWQVRDLRGLEHLRNRVSPNDNLGETSRVNEHVP